LRDGIARCGYCGAAGRRRRGALQHLARVLACFGGHLDATEHARDLLDALIG
jgi:hypothetical protein